MGFKDNGALLLAAVGVSGLIKFFVGREQTNFKPANDGYGGQVYGGLTERR